MQFSVILLLLGLIFIGKVTQNFFKKQKGAYKCTPFYEPVGPCGIVKFKT